MNIEARIVVVCRKPPDQRVRLKLALGRPLVAVDSQCLQAVCDSAFTVVGVVAPCR